MLDVEIIDCKAVDKAAAIFHRDGFVCVSNALTPEQLALGQAGAARVIAQQTQETSLDKANRGFARYSFGQQVQHPEWIMLIDLPTILPILDKVWGSPHYSCMGAGGDYSLPGAKIQSLHADLGDFFKDPLAHVTVRDVPTPFIVINYLMVDFKEINGAIRFIPGTQRSRQTIPPLEEEPERMKKSIICAPAGTAIIRDVRCWHGGTANNSTEIRPMISAGYFAPWFRQSNFGFPLPRKIYDTLSPRAKELCRYIVEL